VPGTAGGGTRRLLASCQVGRYDSRHIPATAVGHACGKGVTSGTLAGCADVPSVRTFARLKFA